MTPEIGICKPYRAKLSPDVCRRNQEMKREKCQGCLGLESIASASPPEAPAASAPRPASYHEALKAALEVKGWTVKQLATAAGLPYFNAFNWVSGRYRPLRGNAQILDRALGTRLAEEYKDLLPETSGLPHPARPRPEKKVKKKAEPVAEPAASAAVEPRPEPTVEAEPEAVEPKPEAPARLDAFLKGDAGSILDSLPAAGRKDDVISAGAALDVLRRMADCLRLILHQAEI